MERVQEDGVRLTEEELEERRQELLAKAEIQVIEAKTILKILYYIKNII